MVPTSGKAKQILVAAAKLLIVALAFYFIYLKLSDSSIAERDFFIEKIEGNFSAASIAIILLLTFLNRYFEILKWKNLVGSFKRISVWESTKQVLAALTLSIFTPNGIGEYGAKALFYPKDKIKEIIFLNLVCNGIQLLISVVFGLLGLLYFSLNYNVEIAGGIFIAAIVAILIGFIAYRLKKISIRGYSFEMLLDKINALPADIHRKNIILGLLRYLTFSHQYYLLFVILGVDLPYILLMSVIAAMYFVASSLPTMQFFDFAVKGSVAVYFFSLVGVNEWIPVFIATLMWLLNVALPVIFGSYFVITFKSEWKRSLS